VHRPNAAAGGCTGSGNVYAGEAMEVAGAEDRRRALAAIAAARRDPRRVVLDGFHALKHALRFGAEIEIAVCADRELALDLARTLAPDIEGWIRRETVPVEAGELSRVLPRGHPTGVAAVASRPRPRWEAFRAALARAPAVLLDRPRAAGNLGAAVRVAAAAGAAGVLVAGGPDPWGRAAVRGAAGLHWALPVVCAVDGPPEGAELVAVDPRGRPLAPGDVGPGTVLAFGSERHGLAPELRARAGRAVSIPMTPGVSSLNLATAVAVVLYHWRLSGGAAP